MRNKLASILLSVFWLAAPAEAGERAVVVELFTSQGCASCRAADAILTELSRTQGVIPLALHVDYWDYLGWKDSFASPAYSKRQRAYADAANMRTIYTPQVVVQGVGHAIGNRRDEVKGLIRQHTEDPEIVRLEVSRNGDNLAVHVRALQKGVGAQLIELVRYRARETVSIRAGENAGKRIEYANIVTAWDPLRKWSGEGELEINVPISGSAPAVILVQSAENGPIVAAAKIVQ